MYLKKIFTEPLDENLVRFTVTNTTNRHVTSRYIFMEHGDASRFFLVAKTKRLS